jgi:hypothetical protein
MAKRKPTTDRPAPAHAHERTRARAPQPSPRTVETRVQALERRVGAVERALRQTRAKEAIDAAENPGELEAE